ncbi:PQQ-dependent sugar dehydrogenase [Zunongwangia sp. F363]|uniref:PQQ-dependent sugar dehydrogenase n=1 Tax=Autumnicola tepida TaxID=3075595 RepID=A0ABU3CCC9_9FLAO|nr:PQQ-dependent sugar dehydrogenase [Zunongwangia sp. F363]MDT0643933.1 PQQ-dependent sugar dehydrogenase [Zunongwangia sp. F363]
MKIMKNSSLKNGALAAGLLLFLAASCNDNPKNANSESAGIDSTAAENNTQLTLPEGFSATVFAEDLGEPRHLAVGESGKVFVKLNSVDDGNGILILSDEDNDGQADEKQGFADYGGTGIAINGNKLYASSNSAVFSYDLDEEGMPANMEQPDTIISGLIDRRQHNSKSIALDNSGNIYVNIGAYSNACQEQDRTKGSPGQRPCPILDSAGGIWRFRADKLRQTYDGNSRFATGLRNVVGLDWNTKNNQLFVLQHGRDQLHGMFPDMYSEEESAELPAETMYALNEGDDAGWPYIYYDQNKNKKILAPEYGGDGEKTGAPEAIDPVVAFPGHMAPNALLFYTGDMFPAKYQNGAFIAFHGSWNRAPEPQKGFFLAFVPFENGRPSGEWEIFADGFAGAETVESPGDAEHRPTGLAQGPDGSLYVSDDAGGTVFKITY